MTPTDSAGPTQDASIPTLRWIHNLLDDPAAQWPGSNALWAPAMQAADADPLLAARLVDTVFDRYCDPASGLILADEATDASARPTAGWPLWSCVALHVYRQLCDDEWGRRIYANLRRNLLAAATYFDPERSGLPCWQSAEEAWIPNAFRPQVATPDLMTLLVLEADALRDFRHALEPDAPDHRIADERNQWVSGLLEFLADQDAGCFSARRVGGGRVSVPVDLAVFPLLWTELPGDWIGPLLMAARNGLIPALARPDKPVAWIERRLWDRTLVRLGALGLADQLQRLPPPADVAGTMDAGQTQKTAPNRWPRGDARTLAAAACLLLALGWGMLVREPVRSPAALDLGTAALSLAALRGDSESAETIDRLLFEEIPQHFRDWQRAVRAEIDGEWEQAAILYRRHDDAVGGSAPALFGMARALSYSADAEAMRQAWQRFLAQYGTSFPDAAEAARDLWWQTERQMSGSFR